MRVVSASVDSKQTVLELLDEFREACMTQIDPTSEAKSTTARTLGGELFDQYVESDDCAMFLLQQDAAFIGIVTANKLPQIRKGTYCAEIEELYVQSKYQGQGGALLLVGAIEAWAQKAGCSSVRLESSQQLARAHAFYHKAGFTAYGTAFEKKL